MYRPLPFEIATECCSDLSSYHAATVLIGLCGDGKSSLACMLSGLSEFEVGDTRHAQTHDPKVLGNGVQTDEIHWFGDENKARITIVDTPGMYVIEKTNTNK